MDKHILSKPKIIEQGGESFHKSLGHDTFDSPINILKVYVQNTSISKEGIRDALARPYSERRVHLQPAGNLPPLKYVKPFGKV